MVSVARRGNCHYLRAKIGYKERFIPLPAPDHDDFEAALAAARERIAELKAENRAIKKLPTKMLEAMSKRRREAGKERLPAWLGPLAREARKRAKRKQHKFELTASDLARIWTRSRGCCEITGLPFCLERRAGSYYRPFAPSLDRIDSRDGYSFRNVRLVCVITNAALNQWGEDAFWMMIAAAAQTRWGKISQLPPRVAK